MSNFKPDLSEKITIRCSKELRGRIAAICKTEDMEESEALRYLLGGGVSLAERYGFEAVMTARKDVIQKIAEDLKKVRRL